MQSGQFTPDTLNLRKALPLAFILAAGLGILTVIIDFLGGIWDLLLLAAWAYIGGYYVNMVLASNERPPMLSVGINGAILGAIAGIVYGIISWVALGIRFSDTAGGSPVDLYFVETGIIAGLAALALYAYKTSAKNS